VAKDCAPYPEPPPDRPARLPGKPGRRRGAWFGVLLTLAVVLCLPLLAYAGILIYLKMGFLERAVNRALTESFGAGAGVGRMEHAGLEAMSAAGMKLPARDGTEPPALDAPAMGAHWDPWAVLSRKHIRQVWIEKPAVALRRVADGQWSLKWPESRPGAYWIEQLQITGGSLVVEWAPGRRVAWDEVRALVARPEPQLQQTVTFQAQWPSSAELHGEALLGPGEALKASLTGTMDLAADLRDVGWPFAPPSGRVAFKLDAQRDWSAYTSATGQVAFKSSFGLLQPGPGLVPQERRLGTLSGRLELPPADGSSSVLRLREGALDAELGALQQLFAWKLAGLCAPKQGQLQVKDFELELDPDQPAKLKAAGVCTVEAGRLGTVTGRVELSPASGAVPVVRLREGQARLDLDALRAAFEPKLLGPLVVTQGELQVKDLELAAPLDLTGMKLKATGSCLVPELRLWIPGVGELPPLAVQAQVGADAEGAQVTNAAVKLGDVGRLVFSAAARWAEFGDRPDVRSVPEFRVESFDLDLGALLKTEFGRRLAAGRLDPSQPAPAESDLPVVARGKLAGKDLKIECRVEEGQTVLSLEALETSGLEIVRSSALGVDLSAWKLAGTLSAQLRFAASDLRALEVGGHVRTTTEPAASARFTVQAAAGPDGKYALRRVELPEMTIPAAELARLLGLKDRFGLTWKGQVTVTDGWYGPEQGSASGLVRFEKLALAGPEWGPFGTGSVQDLSGQARLTWQGGKLTLKGRLEAFVYTVLGRETPVPPLDFALTAGNSGTDPTSGLSPNSLALAVDWEGQRSLAVSTVLTRPRADAWRAVGRIETTLWGGVSGDYDGTLDTGRGLEWDQWRAGPLSLALRNVNLAQLAQTPLAPYLPAALKARGTLPRFSLEATPFRLAELKAGRPASTITMSGEFKDVGIVFSPSARETDRSEAEGLAGSFRGEVALDPASSGMSLNVMATLLEYQLLLDPRFFVYLSVFRPNERVYIPPPRPGEKSTVKFTGQVSPLENGTLNVRVDDLEAKLPGRLDLGGSGRLVFPADWNLFEKGEGLVRLRVEAPDLERLNAEVLKLNIGRRAPNLKLSGGFEYGGKHVWGPDRAALSGELVFRQLGFANADWTVRKLNGTLPLAFHLGLWPGDWPREQKGTVSVGSVERGFIRLSQHPLAVEASPNVIAIRNDLPLAVPGGTVTLSGIRLQDILAPAPSVHFGLRVDNLLLGQLARSQQWPIVGLDGYGAEPPAFVTGQLSPCHLTSEAGPLGAWNLSTEGTLAGRLFEGRLSATGFYSQDCLGVLPVIGVREARIEDMSLGSLTRMNNEQINKWLGRFDHALRAEVKVDVNAGLAGFETAGLNVENIRRFRLDIRSIPKKDKEYFFSRSLAQWIAGEPVEKVTMGAKPLFEGLGLGMKLEGGYLHYLIPLLPNECILSGIRLEGLKDVAMPGGSRQVKGDPSARKEWKKIVGKEPVASGRN
jgi:hypothetical protein